MPCPLVHPPASRRPVEHQHSTHERRPQSPARRVPEPGSPGRWHRPDRERPPENGAQPRPQKGPHDEQGRVVPPERQLLPVRVGRHGVRPHDRNQAGPGDRRNRGGDAHRMVHHREGDPAQDADAGPHRVRSPACVHDRDREEADAASRFVVVAAGRSPSNAWAGAGQTWAPGKPQGRQPEPEGRLASTTPAKATSSSGARNRVSRRPRRGALMGRNEGWRTTPSGPGPERGLRTASGSSARSA
jgi:hypothetical protein